MAAGFFQWLIMSVAGFLHPFFISLTDINHNAANKSLEVSVRIFTDDLEETLRRNCRCKVELMKPVDRPGMENLVSTYIKNHLQLKVDDRPAALEFAGFQLEDGSVWSHFEVKNIASVKQLQVSNTILHDYKTEQINMVHAKINKVERSDKLDYPQATLTFRW